MLLGSEKRLEATNWQGWPKWERNYNQGYNWGRRRPNYEENEAKVSINNTSVSTVGAQSASNGPIVDRKKLARMKERRACVILGIHLRCKLYPNNKFLDLFTKLDQLTQISIWKVWFGMIGRCKRSPIKIWMELFAFLTSYPNIQ